MSAIKLPALTHKLEISLGHDSSENEQVAVLFWKRESLTVKNLPQLHELQRRSHEAFMRKVNEAAAKETADIKAALENDDSGEPKELSGDAMRYATLDFYLKKLETELTELQPDAGEESVTVNLLAKQLEQVQGFIAQMQTLDSKTEKELEAGFEAERKQLIEQEQEHAKNIADLLEFLTDSFRIDAVNGDERSKGESIKATTENLSLYFDAHFMQEAFGLIVAEAKRPLAIRASSGA